MDFFSTLTECCSLSTFLFGDLVALEELLLLLELLELLLESEALSLFIEQSEHSPASAAAALLDFLPFTA